VSATAAAPALPAHLLDCVGRTGWPWRYEITRTSLRAWARGAGYTDAVYYDVATARAAGHPDLPAPPGYVGTPVYRPGLTDEVFSEPSFGQPHVEHGLPHVLDTATEVEHLEPLYAGEELVAITRIAALRPRRSLTGLRGLLVEREVLLTDEPTGRLRARQRRWTLYCEALPWR
jgi:hypothetical protein